MDVFTRFMFYRLRSCIRFCFSKVKIMWIRNTVQPLIASGLRSRKIIFLCLVAVVIILYICSSFFHVKTPHFLHTDKLSSCLLDKTHLFEVKEQVFDVVINRKQATQQKYYVPYVGNGHIGTSADSDNGFFLKVNRGLTLPINYYPVVHPNIESNEDKEATITDFTSGLVYSYKCFQTHSGCVSVGSQLYAHRTRPYLLVQEIKIKNPTRYAASVDLKQVGVSDWKDAKTSSHSTNAKSGEEVQYSLTTGVVVPDSAAADNILVIVIASTKLGHAADVSASGSSQLTVYTIVEYLTANKADVEKVKGSLETKAKEHMSAVLNIDETQLRREHIQVWSQLWETGMSISYSRAPDALNGDIINNTIYYVLSNVPSPMHEVDVTQEKKSTLENSLVYPDRCYDRHHTLQVPTLWVNVQTEQEVGQLAARWLVTLQEHGCKSMVEAGADGVMQAMVLSFGGFHFKDYHLEFNTHPGELHRDYTFRRISYGNNTHVNVTVNVGTDNKAVLYVSLDRNDKPYYACDAGCIDAPVKLSKNKVQLPVKLTEPLTAILYITSDYEHMTQLKDVIHVKTVEEAPAHEHHVMALHRHGNKYGGLPTIFWISIVLLVVVFHLFLFKIIYNEYCGNPQDRYVRTGKYNL